MVKNRTAGHGSRMTEQRDVSKECGRDTRDAKGKVFYEDVAVTRQFVKLNRCDNIIQINY